MYATLTWWEVLIMLATLVCAISSVIKKDYSAALAWGCALIWQLDYFLEREKNRENKNENN